jgi:acyl phosphate:glycerol-3-phosphate acyltransferase
MPTTLSTNYDYAIIVVVSYLLGSIPFGYLLVKTFTGTDVRAQGSGNIGATNVARTGKKGLAIATLVLDAVKGYAAVCIARVIFTSRESYGGAGHESDHYFRLLASVMALAALFAVIGHMYPVWLKFKGGKGVATALGVYLALAPKAIVVAMIVFFVVLALTKYVSLGSILASVSFPIAFWYLHRANASLALMFLITAICGLIVWKHADNIRRLASGTENKFGAKKAGVQ